MERFLLVIFMPMRWSERQPAGYADSVIEQAELGFFNTRGTTFQLAGATFIRVRPVGADLFLRACGWMDVFNVARDEKAAQFPSWSRRVQRAE
jgi:hypothetical protein